MEIKLPKSVKYSSLILISLVLLNFIIKGYYISINSIAGDEPFSIFHAKLDLYTIIKDLSNGNNPPLYEILLHFWIKIVGISAPAVRLLSLIFSSITVIFIYKLGKSFFNIRVAIYTALLFIFSNYQILFAHEARVYALLGLLSVMSMYYFLKIIINNDIHRSTALKLIIVNVALVYAHYFGFWILLIQFLYVIFNKEIRNKHWKKLLIIGGVIFLLYIPNCIVFINRFIYSSANGTWLSPVSDLGNLHTIIHEFSNGNTVVYLVVLFIVWFSAGVYVYKSNFNTILKFAIILFLFPIFYMTGASIFVSTPYIYLLTRETFYVFAFLLILLSFVLYAVFNRNTAIINTQTKVIVFWFWFPFLTMFILSLDSFPYTIPMFKSRYLMMISIAFYLFIAVSLDRILKPSKKSYFLLPAILISLFIFTTQPNISNKRNVSQAIEKVSEIKQENALVLFSPKHFNLSFTYYLNNTFFKEATSIDEVDTELNTRNIYGINNIKAIDLTNCKHVIYLDAGADFSNPDNNILKYLNNHYEQKSKDEVYEIYTIYEFNQKEIKNSITPED